MAEPEKNADLQHNAPKKNYSISILLFLLGIIAVIALAVYTMMRKLPAVFLVGELIALLSLIGLLAVSISAKRRMVRQFALNERYPYAGVQKKEIEAIFDKIAEEEGKRRKLDAFASGVDLKKMPTVSSQPKDEEEKKDSVSASADEKSSDSAEGNDMIPVFPDDEEEQSSDSDGNSSEKDGDAKPAEKDSEKDKKPAAQQNKRPDDSVPKQRKKRPAEEGGRREGQQRPHRPRPYDPYYEDYYYDSRGKRRRAPVYYDEYGNPIRPRVVYDEYGNPIRRRPVDPYRQPSGKKHRPPADGRRPATSGQRQGSHKKRSSSGPVAPVEMTPIKQWSNYGDDYVPVAIVDEEDTAPAVPAARPAGKKKKPANAKEAAERKPYVPHFDEGEVIVTIPDYDDDSDDDYIAPAAAAKAKAKAQAAEAAASGDKLKQPAAERYVPDYSEDEGVVFIPDYDDEADSYSAPPAASSPAAARQQAASKPPAASRAPQPAPAYDDYEEEDEGVVVLPHDEGYEDYIEQKRAEERRAERKASGKVALTIRKLRHKKIRRKSRKYKIFRASSRSLSEYLNSFSLKTKR